MTMIATMLCLALLHPTRGRAESGPTAADGTPIVTLLSHAELLKLTEDERAGYLEAVQDSLMEYEKRMGKYLDELSANGYRPFPILLIDEAYAEDEWARVEKHPKIFRCLYAGWAIRKPRCQPETKVKYVVHYYINTTEGPARSDGRITMELSCQRGQTLCNPVVFGTTTTTAKDLGGPYSPKDLEPIPKKIEDIVRSKVKPVCVTADDRRNVSRECYYKSVAMKASADTKYNDELFKEFKTGFDAMCGEKGVSTNPYFKDRPRAAQDMKDTCAWTQAHLYKAFSNTHPAATRRRSYGPERDFTPADRKSNEAESAR